MRYSIIYCCCQLLTLFEAKKNMNGAHLSPDWAGLPNATISGWQNIHEWYLIIRIHSDFDYFINTSIVSCYLIQSEIFIYFPIANSVSIYQCGASSPVATEFIDSFVIHTAAKHSSKKKSPV